jgi:DNA-binding transcriptional LysR family regulator
MMTLRHLKIFVAVCECGGITKAAEALYMAQPAVSTTIAELEKYYKVVLFDRINQRLVITDMGKELYLKAKDVLSGFEDFEAFANEGGSNPSVRIGCSLTLGKTVLPRFIKQLKSEIPSVVPTVIINRTAMIEKALECGDLDFGFVEGEVTSPHLNAVTFGGDRIVAVCASNYDIADSVTLEELTRHPLLLRENGSASRNLFDTALASAHLTVKPMVESVSNQCLISAAIGGLGVAILPEGLVSDVVRDGTLKVINVANTDFSRTHYLLIHKNKKLNQIQMRTYQLIKQL